MERLWARYGSDLPFIARQVDRHTPAAPKVLDVGCSTGVLMRTLAAAIPDAHIEGIDLDPGAQAEGFDIRHGEFTETTGTYDAITFRFVLEHVPDPHAYLTHARRMVEPGGAVFACVPDIGSAKARQLGAAWPLIDQRAIPIGHIWWFDRRSFQAVAARAGFDVMWLRNRGEAIDHLPGWLRRTLEAALGRDPQRGRFIRWYPLRILWSCTVDAATHRVGWGDCLYAVLRPRGTTHSESAP